MRSVRHISQPLLIVGLAGYLAIGVWARWVSYVPVEETLPNTADSMLRQGVFIPPKHTELDTVVDFRLRDASDPVRVVESLSSMRLEVASDSGFQSVQALSPTPVPWGQPLSQPEHPREKALACEYHSDRVRCGVQGPTVPEAGFYTLAVGFDGELPTQMLEEWHVHVRAHRFDDARGFVWLGVGWLGLGWATVLAAVALARRWLVRWG